MNRLAASVCPCPVFALTFLLALLAIGPTPAAHAQDPDDPAPAADGEVHLLDAIKVASQHLRVRFLYNENELQTAPVTMTDPFPTFADENHCWRWLEAILLAREFAWVRVNEERRLYRVMKLTDLARRAHPVVDDPAALDLDLVWGTLVVSLANADAASAQRAILNLVTRPGGLVQPIQGSNAVMITDSRSQLVQIQRILERLDRPAKKVVRGLTVPDGRAAETGRRLRELFATEFGNDRLRIGSADPHASVLWVRADADIMPQIEEAVALLSGQQAADADATNDETAAPRWFRLRLTGDEAALYGFGSGADGAALAAAKNDLRPRLEQMVTEWFEQHEAPDAEVYADWETVRVKLAAATVESLVAEDLKLDLAHRGHYARVRVRLADITLAIVTHAEEYFGLMDTPDADDVRAALNERLDHYKK